jgi:site-specific DNA recombinase
MKAALYARFSTDKQASIEDQLRVCRRIADLHGFAVVATFEDAAISGGTTQRPGYQSLLAAARRHDVEVIVAEDTSRLWRNMAEQAPRLAELRDLGVHVVTHDLDTRQESAEWMSAILGTAASAYRSEIGRRTRRGLEGRAIKALPTGGRSYGYIAAADAGTGSREVDPAQAEIVRRIFTMYADGMSPRAIAEALNRERVPSPGSLWNRRERRAGGWLASAIAGDVRRGLGVLNNALYRGDVIWNRFRWLRMAADSSRRRMLENPRAEWIVSHDERLRIVPEDLWLAVKRRQEAQSTVIGERVRRGLSRASAKSTGRSARYLLSGLLRCGSCGSSLIVSGGPYYVCSTRVNGGASACENDVRIGRAAVEDLLLEDLRKSLRDPAVVREACQRARKRLRAKPAAPAVTPAQLRKVEEEVGHLTDAVASGLLKSSPALAERLRAAEGELARLRAAQVQRAPDPRIEKLATGLEGGFARLVRDLDRALLDRHGERGRQELRGLLGRFKVEADAREIRFYNEQGRHEAALLRSVGADARNYGSGGRI